MRTLQPERGSERSYGYDSKIGIYNTMYYLVVAGMSRREENSVFVASQSV